MSFFAKIFLGLFWRARLCARALFLPFAPTVDLSVRMHRFLFASVLPIALAIIRLDPAQADPISSRAGASIATATPVLSSNPPPVDAAVPNSPFLSAVLGLVPMRGTVSALPSAMNANASATNEVGTGAVPTSSSVQNPPAGEPAIPNSPFLSAVLGVVSKRGTAVATPSNTNANASVSREVAVGSRQPPVPSQNSGPPTARVGVSKSPFLSAAMDLGPIRGAIDSSPISATLNAPATDQVAANPLSSASSEKGTAAPSATSYYADRAKAGPGVERKQVYPQIANASSNMAGGFAAAKSNVAQTTTAQPDITGSIAPAARSGRPGVSLGQAVGAAVMSHPLMGAQAAKVTGSLADVRTAQGATNPQLQVYAGSGGSYLGSYANSPALFGSVAVPGSSRTDVGFTFRQLVYDFGAAKSDIARSRSLVDAERLRLADQAEDIGLRTANAFLNLLEQEELIAEMDRVVADDNNFANLVKLSEKQGNGTAADVNRIKSKVIEVEALRTDIKTAYDAAKDEFSRLTKLDPDKLGRPTSILPLVPPGFDVAFEVAKQNNPSLLALSAAGVSFGHQLASQKAQALPRVDIQGDGLVKHYVGTPTASQGIVDSRVMLMVSYKLLDGGVIAAQADRIREDKKANDFRTLDEKESIELNLRRFYQALSANRTKETAASQGISIAQKAHSQYLEQFKAGKRTVFEVLDSRMVVFTMHKNATTAKYEQQRAAYGILRNMGRLVETAIRT
jgi:outer membrane protein TolC